MSQITETEWAYVSSNTLDVEPLTYAIIQNLIGVVY